MEKITVKEIYNTLVQMMIQSESISWNRFYNFLMGNSILILAWATIFISQKKSPWGNIVMVSICLLGAISSPFYAVLGKRGRDFLEHYVKQLIKIEDSQSNWPSDFDKLKIFKMNLELRDTLPGRIAGSYYILQAVPYGFSFLYFLMFLASFLG